jgi:hypothetical protein
MQDVIKQCGVNPSVHALGKTSSEEQVYTQSAAAVELSAELALVWAEINAKFQGAHLDLFKKALELEHRAVSWALQAANPANTTDLTAARADMIAQMRQIASLAHKISPVEAKKFTRDPRGNPIFLN